MKNKKTTQNSHHTKNTTIHQIQKYHRIVPKLQNKHMRPNQIHQYTMPQIPEYNNTKIPQILNNAPNTKIHNTQNDTIHKYQNTTIHRIPKYPKYQKQNTPNTKNAQNCAQTAKNTHTHTHTIIKTMDIHQDTQTTKNKEHTKHCCILSY